MNKDFAEMLDALSAEGAEYLVVGAYAVGAHCLPRATLDFDIWIRPTRENAERVWRALVHYGAPLHDLTIEDLANPRTVFQIGVAPGRIDIICSVSGVEFEEAWPNRVNQRFEGTAATVIGLDALLKNKRASGRPKDMIDVEVLERRLKSKRV